MTTFNTFIKKYLSAIAYGGFVIFEIFELQIIYGLRNHLVVL